MLQKTVIFSIRLFVAATLIFVIHVFVLRKLGLPMYNNLIVQGYCVNVALAVFIYTGLSLLQKKYSDQLGFLFMAGSLLKFAVFFVFFSPHYRADGEITRLEFVAFFVPYLVCLFTETLAVIKILDPSKKKG